MVKNKGNYGPRKRTRGSAMESARPAKLSKVKYGTLSRKDREFVEQYGQMEEDVLLSDQADELNDASTMDHQRISFSRGSKIMTERELDMQLAKERQLKSYADDQDNIDEESSGEDGVDDDSWQHRPSAHSRLIEMLKMEQPEAGFYDDEQSTSELFAAEDTLDDNSDDEKNDDSYYEKDDEDDSSGSSSAISEDEQTDEAAKPSDGEELEYCESEYSSVESGQGAWNIENDVLNGGNDSMHSVANEYEAYQRQFNNPDSDGQSEFSAAVEARKSKQFNPISSLKDNLCGQITVQRLLSYGEDNSPSQLPQELIQYSIKNRLLNGWEKVTNSAGFSPLQSRVFPYLANYQDLLMVSHQRSIDSKASGTGAEIMQSYVLHALNHIFITRDKILKNNDKLRRFPDEEIRDQGFTRPKVLILLPFRSNAYKFINMLIEMSGCEQVENKKRFTTEFGDEDDQDTALSGDPQKPQDFNELFAGNIDDCFRIGLKFSRKSLKLYSQFYSSDIIVASPLGLRLIGAGKKSKSAATENEDSVAAAGNEDHDYLSSIEVLVIDQIDVIAMQNTEHLRHIFTIINKTPRELHDTDFSRLRHWYLDKKAKYLRQTIMFGSYLTPEINNLWSTYCMNVNKGGRVKIRPIEKGSIRRVIANVQQIFTRFPCKSVAGADDARFEYFTKKAFPKIQQSVVFCSHSCIFVPSYFDFLRLRNWFDAQEISFAAISEYTSDADVSRARSDFYHGRKQYLLITERFHFFRRYRLRGINHLIFYGVPDNPVFYPEFINMVMAPQSTDEASNTGEFNTMIMIIYGQYDALALERIVGTQRLQKMLIGDRDTFMFS